MTLEEIEAAIKALEQQAEAIKAAPALKWRYKRKKLPRWQTFAIAGMPKDEAIAFAIAGNHFYTATWLQVSVDEGKTWIDTPPGKEIPIVD